MNLFFLIERPTLSLTRKNRFLNTGWAHINSLLLSLLRPTRVRKEEESVIHAFGNTF
jgi:hypothetical protein